MASRKSVQKNCLELLADLTLFSTLITQKLVFAKIGVYAGIIIFSVWTTSPEVLGYRDTSPRRLGEASIICLDMEACHSDMWDMWNHVNVWLVAQSSKLSELCNGNETKHESTRLGSVHDFTREPDAGGKVQNEFPCRYLKLTIQIFTGNPYQSTQPSSRAMRCSEAEAWTENGKPCAPSSPTCPLWSRETVAWTKWTRWTSPETR